MTTCYLLLLLLFTIVIILYFIFTTVVIAMYYYGCCCYCYFLLLLLLFVKKCYLYACQHATFLALFDGCEAKWLPCSLFLGAMHRFFSPSLPPTPMLLPFTFLPSPPRCLRHA